MMPDAPIRGLLGVLLLGGCALAKNADTGEDKQDFCEIRAVPIFFDAGELVADGEGMQVDLSITNNHADCAIPKEDWYVTCPAAAAVGDQPAIPATDDFVSVNLDADSVTLVSGHLDALLAPGEEYGCVLFYEDAVADNITIVAP